MTLWTSITDSFNFIILLFLPFYCFPLARLREPQDGLFTGQIDAVDTVNYSYRVTFDRPGLFLAKHEVVCGSAVLLFVTF